MTNLAEWIRQDSESYGGMLSHEALQRVEEADALLARYEAALRAIVAEYEETEWLALGDDDEAATIRACALNKATVAAEALGIQITHPPDDDELNDHATTDEG